MRGKPYIFWLVALLLIVIGAWFVHYLRKSELRTALDIAELIDLGAAHTANDGPLELVLTKDGLVVFSATVDNTQVHVPSGAYNGLHLSTHNSELYMRGEFSIKRGELKSLPPFIASVEYSFGDTGGLVVTLHFSPSGAGWGALDYVYATFMQARDNRFCVSDAEGDVIWEEGFYGMDYADGKQRLRFSGPMPKQVIKAARAGELFIAPKIRNSFANIRCRESPFQIPVTSTAQ